MALVYLAKNTVNGKEYVGYTSRNLSARRAQHEAAAATGSTECRLFYYAMRKHGPDAFVWTVLAEGTCESMLRQECSEIQARGTLSPRGYNLSTGGDTGHWHPDSKARRSAQLRGVPQDPALVAKRAAKLRGQKRSAEEVARMCARAQVSMAKLRTITAEQEQDLLALRDQGQTLQGLADHFGISQTTVHKYLKRAGRTGAVRDRRKVSPEQEAELLALRAAGWTYKRLGAHFGISPGVALDYVQRAEREAKPAQSAA